MDIHECMCMRADMWSAAAGRFLSVCFLVSHTNSNYSRLVSIFLPGTQLQHSSPRDPSKGRRGNPAYADPHMCGINSNHIQPCKHRWTTSQRCHFHRSECPSRSFRLCSNGEMKTRLTIDDFVNGGRAPHLHAN